MQCKKTILIDLDGVLNEYTGKYLSDFIPPIKKGAREFLEKMSLKYDLKIFTTRDSKLAEKWLIDNKIYDCISEVTNHKIPAWLIIDDRCINFNGNYNDLTNQIANFTPWYK